MDDTNNDNDDTINNTPPSFLLTRRDGGHLSDYSHRLNAPPSINNKDDLVTEPTPAQKERLIYLIDDALDTLQDGMEPGNKMNDRITSANSVLDRAGINSRTALLNRGDDGSAISADALVQVIGGLAQMFGKSSSIKPKDVTPVPPVMPDENESAVINDNDANDNQNDGKAKGKSALPNSLLAVYGADLTEKESH
jgi:hypothetical protein